MKTLLTFIGFLLFLCSCSFHHVFVNRSRRATENALNYGFKNHKVNITKTDSSLTYSLRDTLTRPLTIYCSFDKSKNCIYQKMNFDCDSCYHKSLKSVLKEKTFGWQAAGTNRYLSGYAKHLLLVANDKEFYYTLTLINYKKNEYQNLLSAK